MFTMHRKMALCTMCLCTRCNRWGSNCLCLNSVDREYEREDYSQLSEHEKKQAWPRRLKEKWREEDETNDTSISERLRDRAGD